MSLFLILQTAVNKNSTSGLHWCYKVTRGIVEIHRTVPHIERPHFHGNSWSQWPCNTEQVRKCLTMFSPAAVFMTGMNCEHKQRFKKTVFFKVDKAAAVCFTDLLFTDHMTRPEEVNSMSFRVLFIFAWISFFSENIITDVSVLKLHSVYRSKHWPPSPNWGSPPPRPAPSPYTFNPASSSFMFNPTLMFHSLLKHSLLFLFLACTLNPTIPFQLRTIMKNFMKIFFFSPVNSCTKEILSVC